MSKAERKFNGTVERIPGDPDFGDFTTFDHHLGGGSFQDAQKAALDFLKKCPPEKASWDKERGVTRETDNYRRAIKELSDPTPRDIEFEYLQDTFRVTKDNSPQDTETGVRNFNDRRVRENLEVGFDEKGRIVRADGMVRKGWRWVKAKP